VSWKSSASALAAFVVLSFLYFGLPVAAHPGRVVVGSINDPKLFIWMFAWWPHAIVHGQNPFVTHAIWAPSGYDLVWATSIPALALVFWPLTALAGPVVTYNVVAILLPALAAWTAYLLCRYLTRAFWPSLFGGYVFGFSSYMLGHEEGHLNLTAVFLVPLMVLAIVRALRDELDRRGLALRLGPMLGVQLLISTETSATFTIALLLAAALAFGLVPAARRRLVAMAPSVGAAYLVGAFVASALLYYALTDFVSEEFTRASLFHLDAANLVVPTHTTAVAGDVSARISDHYYSTEPEETGYLGIPLLALFGLYAWERRRDRIARFLVAGLLVAIVLALGSKLWVEGHGTIAMPWTLVDGLPVFDNIYPARFTLYATLAAAVVAALWTATSTSPRWLRIALPYLVIAALVPNTGKHHWDEKLQVPRFIAAGDYKRCLAPGENVLVLPYGYMGNSTLWQALAGFRFRMPGGEVGDQIPRPFRTPAVLALGSDLIPPNRGADIRDLARAKGATAILVDPSDSVPWQELVDFAGQPKRVGGLLLYRLGKPAAQCGRTAAAT
jgi:hypothetical protein